jgi:nitroreductase
MDVYEAVRKRRSVRRYKGDNIAPEILERLVDAAQWAPSWAHTQCVKIVLCDDTEVKSRIRACVPEKNPAHTALGQAPLIAVFCAQTGRSGFKKGEPSTPRGDWMLFDTALAMQNFMLAAHAEGLATVCVGVFDSGKVGEVLGLPEGMEAVTITPLGYPDQSPNAPDRKSRNEFVHRNRYSQVG